MSSPQPPPEHRLRVIIAGGRDYDLSREDLTFLDNCHAALRFTEVVCGMARGADTGGRLWAESRGIPVAKFPANWELGKTAGFKRNEEMAAYADAFICFPGGSGTNHMWRTALRKGLKWIPTLHEVRLQLLAQKNDER